MTNRELWASRIGVLGYNQHHAHAASVGIYPHAVYCRTYPEYVAYSSQKLPRSGVTVAKAMETDGYQLLSKADWAEARRYLAATLHWGSDHAS